MMSRQLYAESGSAGVFAVIAILLVSMANIPDGTVPVLSLELLGPDTIYVNENVVNQGEIVLFYVDPVINGYLIEYFLLNIR